MGRGRHGPRTVTTRISSDLDIFLGTLAMDLSNRMGRPVTKTEASQILAASQRPTVLIKKRRGELRIGRSLVWI